MLFNIIEKMEAGFKINIYFLLFFLCGESALSFCGYFSLCFWGGDWELFGRRGFSAGSARYAFAAIFRCVFGAGNAGNTWGEGIGSGGAGLGFLITS